MTDWALAQLNIAHLKAPLDSPEIAEFVANLDHFNALAENSPGFIWRFKDEENNNATTMEHPFGDDLIANLSMWESVEHLHSYVYRSEHASFMSRRKEWFTRMVSAYSALWWVPLDHRPDLVEAHQKLTLLDEKGPGPDVFSFKTKVQKPE